MANLKNILTLSSGEAAYRGACLSRLGAST